MLIQADLRFNSAFVAKKKKIKNRLDIQKKREKDFKKYLGYLVKIMKIEEDKIFPKLQRDVGGGWLAGIERYR